MAAERNHRKTDAAYAAFDSLATLVAVVSPQGVCQHVNAGFEVVLGVPRRHVVGSDLAEWIVPPTALRETLAAVAANRVATSRFEAELHSPLPDGGPSLAVLVIVNQSDSAERIVVELIAIDQQARQDREERALDQSRANKELVRNLAHEIKNPLGGIRGAAQLLEMEIVGQPPGRPKADAPPWGAAAVGGVGASQRDLTEYTRVIIHEADRLQALVDRLLAPHRGAVVMGDVNVHEVCERVRSVVMAEHPRGLNIVRDYDTSLPEFRGDRERLIQAVLNIVSNAAQALHERIGQGDARIVLRTRVARQVTIGKQRWRLALQLHVEDNGPGVPEAIRDHIFFPLVSGREQGSGLGLTLAQTFVQQHQGMIECDSVPGRTVFTLSVPLP
jgi:two-component system, NtrC family, nitrogen regulation sensor histidine kinase GlnL